jgi:hypothetical protein
MEFRHLRKPYFQTPEANLAANPRTEFMRDSTPAAMFERHSRVFSAFFSCNSYFIRL